MSEELKPYSAVVYCRRVNRISEPTVCFSPSSRGGTKRQRWWQLPLIKRWPSHGLSSEGMLPSWNRHQQFLHIDSPSLECVPGCVGRPLTSGGCPRLFAFFVPIIHKKIYLYPCMNSVHGAEIWAAERKKSSTFLSDRSSGEDSCNVRPHMNRDAGLDDTVLQRHL